MTRRLVCGVACLLICLLFPFLGMAQKYAFVDTEYILNKIPSYRSAKDEVEKLSKRYQQEIEQGLADIQKHVKDFQAEQVLLTPEKRQKRQQELVDAEAKIKDLQQKYFGREGLLFKKQEELIKPIQDQVFAAVKELANEGGYAAIFDVSASAGILYSSPRYDKSDEVLRKLGFN